MRMLRAALLVLLSAVLAGCGGGSDLLLPGAGEPASVTLLQGDDQNGRVGEALPQPLVAAVADASGRPVEGATVVFVLNDPAPGAALDPDTGTTTSDGMATTRIVLGSRPGDQTGQVRALGGHGTPTATADFTLTALSEDANGIRSVGGENQSGPVGSTLPIPLTVEVADAFGNPIANVGVAWTVEGGGTVSAATTTTGDDGRTSVERTLGPTAGAQRTLATVNGLAGSPVAFVHTATAGAASGVSIVAGDHQTGPVGTELPTDLVVEVRDAQNNAVPNVAVTWVIGMGGGGITPVTSPTDENGRATATWTLGAEGDNTVSAVVSGIGVAVFSAKATAGAPARLALLTQPAGTAVSGVVLSQQPVVQLLDPQGNEVHQPDVEVRASLVSGGGSLGGSTSQRTDVSGQAAFTDLVLTGAPGTRTLRFAATGYASVTSAAIALGAAPTVTTITADTPDPSRAGVQVTVEFSVTAAGSTPTGSVRVSDGGDVCSGELSNGKGSCKLTLNTVGSRTLTAEYAASGGFAASSTTEGHTVEAAPAPVLSLARQPSPTATLGTPLAQQPRIQLQTGDGADLAIAGVGVSVSAPSCAGTLSGTTSVNTDGQGQADFTDLVIGGSPGQCTLVFSATGYTGVTSAPIDVQPPPPSGSTSSVTASPPSVSPGATSTITVTVRDAGGNPLSGRSVTLNGGSDPSIAPGSAVTGSDGTATFVFTSTVVEIKNVTAESEGVALGSTTVEVAAPPQG